MLAWPNGTAGPCQLALCARAQRGHCAVATRAMAWWRGFAGGLGVARLAGTLRGTDGGCAR
jgi:hypothetical protein